jgi:hypothetical protein
MINPDFDPLATLEAAIESINGQAKLLEELVKAHNRQEQMLHHLSRQCEFLNEELEKERAMMIRINQLVIEKLDDIK